MSNITTYPGIPVVAGEDLMIISDISTKGNPTKTVSVTQLGAYIGATGGGAGVATVNGVSGAVTLVGGTGVDLVVAGQNITINSTSSGGTVTSVAATFGGNAFALTGTPITAAGTLAITPGGNVTQYINGAGNLANLTTLPVNLAPLGVSRTSGEATWNPTTKVLDIPNYGSGGSGLASVSSGAGLISTGTSTDPIINIDLSGNDNYILSGTGNEAVAGGDQVAYSDVNTRAVQFSSVTSLINNGIGYTSAALRLTPQSIAAPTLTVLHNSIGGTFSIVRSSAGVYTLSNSSSVFSLSTVCFITNPNAQAPSSGTGLLPQPTTIERFGSGISVSDLRINCFRVETGSVSGSASDFGIGKDVMVEVRIYGASS